MLDLLFSAYFDLTRIPDDYFPEDPEIVEEEEETKEDKEEILPYPRLG